MWKKIENIIVEVVAWICAAIFFIGLVYLLSGCKSVQYVPIETVKTERVTVHDTIKQSDSTKTQANTIIREARPEDSVMIAQLGIKLKRNERLLILLQKELQEHKSNRQESHTKDSGRVDSVQVPVPVERKMTKWETFCIDYGKVMAGSTIVLLLLFIYIIVRWFTGRKNDICNVLFNTHAYQ